MCCLRKTSSGLRTHKMSRKTRGLIHFSMWVFLKIGDHWRPRLVACFWLPFRTNSQKGPLFSETPVFFCGILINLDRACEGRRCQEYDQLIQLQDTLQLPLWRYSSSSGLLERLRLLLRYKTSLGNRRVHFIGQDSSHWIKPVS